MSWGKIDWDAIEAQMGKDAKVVHLRHLNWPKFDKNFDEMANEARYQLRREHRKSSYRAIVWITVATIAIIWFVAAKVSGALP